MGFLPHMQLFLATCQVVVRVTHTTHVHVTFTLILKSVDMACPMCNHLVWL